MIFEVMQQNNIFKVALVIVDFVIRNILFIEMIAVSLNKDFFKDFL